MGRRYLKPRTRGLILLLSGAPFAAIGILAAFGAHELQLRGVLTQANVVEKYTSRVATGGKGALVLQTAPLLRRAGWEQIRARDRGKGCAASAPC